MTDDALVNFTGIINFEGEAERGLVLGDLYPGVEARILPATSDLFSTSIIIDNILPSHKYVIFLN